MVWCPEGTRLRPFQTNDFSKGLAIVEWIESGIVYINDQPVDDEPQVPLGGVSRLDEFTELRWVAVQRTLRQLTI